MTAPCAHVAEGNDAPSHAPSAPAGDGSVASTRDSWRRLHLWELLVVGTPIVVVGVLACVYIPRSICYGDNGEFQLASMTLGIMHPPGYPGLTTLGYLITIIPVSDKPLLVSLATVASGLAVLWFCALFQIRLGLHAAVASAVTLMFAAHRRFWFNIVAPEVYMPALLFLVIAAYLLFRFARQGLRRDLLLSAVCLGICFSNRPPALLTVPFFVAAYWFAARALHQPVTSRIRGVLLAGALALIPVAYSFAYVLVRDTPATTYNYIEQHNAGHDVLPDASEGLAARVRRVVWLFTAEQFQPEFGTTLSGLRSKLRWFRNDLLYGQPVRLALSGVIALIGLILCFRRSPTAAWLLSGFMLHSFFFICIYRIYGQAADLSPFVFAAAVLIGAALAPLFPDSMLRRRAVVTALVALTAVVTVWQSANLPARWRVGRDADAVAFLAELDLASVPQDALILTGWSHAIPMWYALYADVNRPDVEVYSGEIGRWDAKVREAGDRPVLAVHQVKSVDDRPLEPYRNIWRVLPSERTLP